ncbi:MAG: HD domain-containing protein [Dehalococcoidales bacterium]|nr:HD domain-containing protein [Dehalococcoidales bacterium]
MRRITIKYAQPGMILGMPVYDYFGKEVLGRRTKLSDQHISLMNKNSVSEILIEDWRVDDVIVAPMISPEKEGKLADAFRQLLISSKNAQSINVEGVNDVNVAIMEIARNLSLSILGEINVSCSVSQNDYAYVQPVKSATLSMALGQRLGMPTDRLVIIGMSAILKDISNIYLSLGTNQAPPSSIDETEIIPEHPMMSYKLIKQVNNINDEIARAVLQHHECWCGRGYPRGLKEQQISPYAQIIAAADAFTSLVVDHPDKDRYMSHEAIEYIMAGSGDQFNPDLVESFVRKIPAYPNGLNVKLNTGEIGIVSDPNLGFVARPFIRICYEPERGNLKKPYDINLAKAEYQHMLISKVLEYD